jgi:hypothetical protein
LGVQATYENKARKLMTKLRDNPAILSRTGDGEIGVNGQPVTGTDFNELFKNMVMPNPNLNLPGIAPFLGALRQIGIKSNELSGARLHQLYRGTQFKGAPRARLADLRRIQTVVREEEEEEEDDDDDKEKFADFDESSFSTPQVRRPTFKTSLVPVSKQSGPSSSSSSSNQN